MIPVTVQSLTLALLLIDFELEHPRVQPAPEDWNKELAKARVSLAELKEHLYPASQSAMMRRPDCGFIKGRKPHRRRERVG